MSRESSALGRLLSGAQTGKRSQRMAAAGRPARNPKPKANGAYAMRVRPINRCAGVIAYVLAIGGTGLLTLKLSSVLATQAIALTQPYFLDNCPCLPSLIEQRRMAAEFAVPPMVDGAKERVAALEAPSISVDVLAAQMDLAETQEWDGPLPARVLQPFTSE